ncbi:MAG: hypothetical protein QOC72_2015 [Methylobacteriaceae bacterium]|jgi:hypothetical protein|nr:hypothetical protein [Methylobacteriaceae bacterium]
MQRRHLRIYRRPKPSDEALAGLERALDGPEKAPSDEAPRREFPPTDYRSIVAVIVIVIFSLAMIAFLLSLRMQ